MSGDLLYLLKPGFMDSERGPFFCPGCAQMVGLLELYPELKGRLSVRYVDFSRPRPELVELLGEENQSCPVLVIESVPAGIAPDIKLQRANGRAFVERANEIRGVFGARPRDWHSSLKSTGVGWCAGRAQRDSEAIYIL
jgi:hypothetical protein